MKDSRLREPGGGQPVHVPDAKFKIETDFAPLVQTGTAYNVLVVNPSVPVHSVAELIAYLKKDPGHACASAGRVVQARNRRAGDARALQPVPAGDRGPDQRRQYLSVH